MKEYKFSRNFEVSVEVYVFKKALTMKKFSHTLWRAVRISQHWTKP